MLKRDFIMIQIEELAKVVLQIIMNRNTNAARHTPELIQTIYSSLKLDRPTLMTAQPEELVRRLDSDDNGGILRLEIAVTTRSRRCCKKPRQSWNIYKRTTTHFLWNA